MLFFKFVFLASWTSQLFLVEQDALNTVISNGNRKLYNAAIIFHWQPGKASRTSAWFSPDFLFGLCRKHMKAFRFMLNYLVEFSFLILAFSRYVSPSISSSVGHNRIFPDPQHFSPDMLFRPCTRGMEAFSSMFKNLLKFSFFIPVFGPLCSSSLPNFYLF